MTALSLLNSQILSDSIAVGHINSGMDYLYSRQFDKAKMIFTELERLYPGHPVNYLYHSNIIYWENYPLIPSSPYRNTFEEDLNNCMELAAKKEYSEKYAAESLLVNVCARGFLLLFYADNDLSFKVIPLATGTYKYIIRSFDFVSSFSDFYYFTGIYNYYREEYPKIRPVYKPLASLFPPGDKARGLAELERAAELSIFLKAEAYSLLSWIYTGFENNFTQALFFSRKLTEKYPENHMFRALHIKILLLLKQYDPAEDLLKIPDNNSGNRYYDAQVLIFKGIIQEKKYRNYALAKKFYEEGISSASFFGNYADEYCGYAYMGLSRVCEYYGDRTGRKVYRRKGYDLIDFKKVSFE
jgi:tetratricopeptide (TPR) repeat protein